MKKHIIAALLITALIGVAADTGATKPNKAPVKVAVNVDALKKELIEVKKENKVLKSLLEKAKKEIQKLEGRKSARNDLSLDVAKRRAALMEKFDKNKNGKLEANGRPTRKQLTEFFRSSRKK